MPLSRRQQRDLTTLCFVAFAAVGLVFLLLI